MPKTTTSTPETNRHPLSTNRRKSRETNVATCTHQPLPMMEGPPLRLMIDSEAIPVACHTPVPVPLHWQEEIKAGLDQDVRLGVIEPVEIGEPVTWCHRMVICAKNEWQTPKNSRPTAAERPCCHQGDTPYPITQSPFY